jgi:translation initiation factor IF-1
MRKKTKYKKFENDMPLKNEHEEMKQGRVIEAMPNTHFKIQYKDGKTEIGYLAGKMKVFKIRVLVGDNVETISDMRGGKARIVKRL